MGTDKQIAIIGHGFVGKATELLLDTFYEGTDIQIHDPDKGYEIENWSGIQYAFVCVPTDLGGWKTLDISIVEKVLNDLSTRSCASTVVPVIRSTVGPDQALMLTKKYGAVIMPEFLREKHWEEDVLDTNLPILVGATPPNHHDFVMWLSNIFDKRVWVVNPGEASAIKMFRNATLAVNVGLANEFKEICDVYDLHYPDIREFFMEDETLGTHWQVPGPDGQYGFGGTCLPKDLTHSSSLCYSSNIMEAALAANKIRRKDGKSNRQD
tara:strand:+ start:2564 stop:3364 length:801 start_codon:yes stop_codon:yes gene_type:complete